MLAFYVIILLMCYVKVQGYKCTCTYLSLLPGLHGPSGCGICTCTQCNKDEATPGSYAGLLTYSGTEVQSLEWLSFCADGNIILYFYAIDSRYYI